MKLVLEALAHFHGSWWQYLNAEGAYRYKASSLTGKEVEAFCGGLGELEVGSSADLRSAARVRPKEIAKLLKESEDSEKVERAASRLEICDAMKRMRHHGKSSNSSRVRSFKAIIENRLKKGTFQQISTMCHGDLWIGNVLFRTDGLGSALKCKLMNFHVMCKGHPVDDIAYFLYTSTNKVFRDIYLDLCLRTYFGVLKERPAKTPLSKCLAKSKKMSAQQVFSLSLSKFL